MKIGGFFESKTSFSLKHHFFPSKTIFHSNSILSHPNTFLPNPNLISHFWDTKYRLEWEHTIEKFKILEVLDGTTIVLLQDHKRVWPAAKRDAVYLSSMQCLSDFKSDDPCYLDTWIVTNFSVEHDQAPYNPSDNNVRVFIDVCMMCQTYKKDASKSENDRENIFTKVTYISQVDPGGWLPPAALRKVYKKEYPRFLRNFSKYVNDKTKGNKNVLYEHKYE